MGYSPTGFYGNGGGYATGGGGGGFDYSATGGYAPGNYPPPDMSIFNSSSSGDTGVGAQGQYD